MKKYIIGSLVLISQSFLFAQNYYPLSIGDIRYWNAHHSKIDSVIEKNGYEYYQTNNNGRLSYSRENEDNNIYQLIEGKDSLVYMLGGEVGDE